MVTAMMAAPSDADAASAAERVFECNVCLDLAKEPVVTLCGHLFCWPCLWRWMQVSNSARACPVCKAAVDVDKVIPIYGRGNDLVASASEAAAEEEVAALAAAAARAGAPDGAGADGCVGDSNNAGAGDDPAAASVTAAPAPDSGDAVDHNHSGDGPIEGGAAAGAGAGAGGGAAPALPVPPRPSGQRTALEAAPGAAAAGLLGQLAPGVLPSLFGFQLGGGAAASVGGGGGGAYIEALTPEQQHQAFLSRLLLMLGSFVIMCLLLF